jgi:hypothetical protein
MKYLANDSTVKSRGGAREPWVGRRTERQREMIRKEFAARGCSPPR